MKIDMIDKKFGLLTVKEQSKERKNREIVYICDCDCGSKNVHVTGNDLRRGHTKSCGCLVRMSRIKYNKYKLCNNYYIGYTNNTNKKFYFDIDDYDNIKKYMWQENKAGYIITYYYNTIIYLHRLIMNPESNMVIDHINHNLFDNRKNNLRVVTQEENGMNKSKNKNNKSGVTGVSYYKKEDKWIASIQVHKKSISLGQFDKFEDAVKVRKEAEEKYFGKYSYDNSIDKNCI